MVNKKVEYRIEESKFGRYVQLFDDEELCKKCKGDRLIYNNSDIIKRCDFCNATGKVNFLDNIFGRRKSKPRKIFAGPPKYTFKTDYAISILTKPSYFIHNITS